MQDCLSPVWNKRVVVHYDMLLAGIALTVCHLYDFMEEIHRRHSPHAAQNTNSFTQSNHPFVYNSIVTAQHQEANSCVM